MIFLPFSVRGRPWLAIAGLAGLLAVAPLVACVTAWAAQASSAVHLIDQARVEAPAGADAPAAASASQVQRLPDEWTSSRPGFAGTVVYRLDLPPAPSADPRALYLPRACGAIEVRWAGHTILQRPQAGPPRCDQAQLVALPGDTARGGLVEVRLAGRPRSETLLRQDAGYFGAPRVGPEWLLHARAERQRAAGVWLPRMLAAMLGLFALGWLAVALWGGAAIAGPTGLLLGGAALLEARELWLGWLPAGRPAEAAVAMLIAALAGGTVLWLQRWEGARRRRVEAALLAQVLLVPLTVLVVPAALVHDAALGWWVVHWLQVAVAVGVCVRALHRGGRASSPWVAAGGGLALAFAAVEWAVQAGAGDLPASQPTEYALPVLLAGLTLAAARHFVASTRGEVEAQAAMEQEVARRTAEIEQRYAEMAEARIEQVAEAERKRIAGDLHDDLGAKLLTIVHTSSDERISTLAREALEEMRLSVRGLTGKPVKVADALADWRAETVSRLGQAAVQVDWMTEHDNDERHLSARAYVQTTRILREAISNILKHSGASACTIRCVIDETDFNLVIQDNGRGIPLELDGKLDRGHGMASMKRRAKQLSGQCLVESGPGFGTVIRLTLPL